MVTYVIPPATVVTLNGDEQFETEKVVAYELGYRFSPVSAFSVDIALYFNDYDDLRSFDRVAFEQMFVNNMDGYNYGLEVASNWQVPHGPLLQLSYTYIDGKFDLKKGQDLSSVDVAEGSSPQHQISLRSSFDINEQWQCDFWLRYVDELEVASVQAWNNDWVVDDYIDLDVSLSWLLRHDLKLQLVGQNLLNGEHLEFVQESFTTRTEIKRSVYVKCNWEF